MCMDLTTNSVLVIAVTVNLCDIVQERELLWGVIILTGAGAGTTAWATASCSLFYSVLHDGSASPLLGIH